MGSSVEKKVATCFAKYHFTILSEKVKNVRTTPLQKDHHFKDHVFTKLKVPQKVGSFKSRKAAPRGITYPNNMYKIKNGFHGV